MFRTAPDTEPAPAEVVPSELIPLSHFELDHPQPVEGWSDFLGRRGIALRPDDIGRDSIRRSDAQMLLHERRQDELRAAKRRQLAEAEAVEQDQRRRAQIWTGLPAIDLPVGVNAATAMLQASHDARPRRTSVLQEALSNTGTLTFHSLQDEAEAS